MAYAKTTPKFVKLKLTHDEADFLKDILWRVGGSPHTSRRAFSDSICSALRDAGVQGSKCLDMEKYIYCNDNKPK